MLTALIGGFLATALWSPKCFGYAWMIRHGQAQCANCHVDPSGGETLTAWGRSAASALLTGSSSSDLPGRGRLLFGINEPEFAKIGGSFRAMAVSDLGEQYTRVFPMQADLYGAVRIGGISLGGSMGVSRTSPARDHTEKALLVGDSGKDALAWVSRSHWLGYRPTRHVFVRVGRLHLPFGVRVPEHTLWVRSETLTDRESDQQHGLTWAYTKGRWRGEMMAVAGNFQIRDDDFRERGYAGHLEYRWTDALAVGVSGLSLTSARELRGLDQRTVRHAYGATLRSAIGKRVVILGEMNLLQKTGRGWGHVGMWTADYEPLRSLHLSATAEALRTGAVDGDDVGGAGRADTRWGGWLTLNWFFYEHLNARLDFVARQNRSPQLLAQLHLFL